MRILFVTSECAPFSKSGGLADVACSLPPALKDAGEEIAIVTPLYQCVKDKFSDKITFVKEGTIQLGWRELYYGLYKGERDGVPVWFIDNEEFFNRPKLYGYDDDALRFAYFSKAVVELLPEYEFVPQIIHCNDWETALTIIYLKDAQTFHRELRTIKTVYTIHNIAYQGQFGANTLSDIFGLDGGWYLGGLGYEYEGRHDVNLMKGAMLMADAVTTVSPTYAKELHYPYFAHGLQGVVDIVDGKLYGILNGIDVEHFNPETDPVIPANFTVKNMKGKAECKAYIQEAFGLEVKPEWPVLASVARLVEQKGIELIKEILPKMMDMGVQLIVFGQGEEHYVEYFNWAKKLWPGQIGFSDKYNEEMASKVFAGADFYLMPSRFEPCGLSQMMAMRYGTVPIVHSTGGLKDSVRRYSDFDGIGDGFSFAEYSGKDLFLAIQEAVKIYFGDVKTFNEIRKRDMTKNLSWNKSAQQYMRMYAEISDNKEGKTIPFDKAFQKLKKAYIKVDEKNKELHPEIIDENYHRIIQIRFNGRAEGTMYVEFSKGDIHVEPYSYSEADAYVEATFDNLLDIAAGKVSVDKLFLNGQLKISGNLSKGYEMRTVLAPIK
ncbi:MAG: glycogen/starch synthase [Agathobacter sp.]|nr:glycogen/starch synthase [Agathobacter sp.]